MSAFICPYCFAKYESKGWFGKAPQECDPCNKMGRKIDDSFIKAPSLRITVVGSKGSGKTHFFTLLIQRIREMATDFGWSLRGLNDDTLGYDSAYKQLSQGDVRGVRSTLNSTNKGTITPLHYELTCDGRTVALAFADTAGEALVNTTDITAIGNYFVNASAIICLIDPLQLPRIRNEVVSAGRMREDDLPEIDKEELGSQTGTILNRITNILKAQLRTGQKNKVPLAVAFSKIDALRYGGDITQGVYNTLMEESRHRSGFHEAQFNNIDATIHSWLQRVDASANILNQCNGFEKTGFFGFSALGQNPGMQGVLTHALRPIRVEDPFLWLLHQNNFIKTIKR